MCVTKSHDCVCPQVHYSSFQVSFLDFEEEDQEGGMAAEEDEGMGAIEDDEGIEGYVRT